MQPNVETVCKLNSSPDLSGKRRVHRWLWILMLIFFVLGFFVNRAYGWLALSCMVAPLVVAVKKGRYWCGWMCPRGSFYEHVLGKLKPGGTIPAWLRLPVVRWTIVSGLLLMMTVRLWKAWGDFSAMGGVLFQTIAVTTLAGILLGLVFHRRTWCAICPMGSIASVVGKGKEPLQITGDCVDCKRCTKVCPQQLPVSEFRHIGTIDHGDCLKCQQCVTTCRRGALSHPTAG